MATVLGINAVFHDPAAALVVDGRTVAAAEEERFTRRKHGKVPVPFSTWELPENAISWCLSSAGVEPEEVDAVGYSYDPDLAPRCTGDVTSGTWEELRTLMVRRAPLFLKASFPGLGHTPFHHIAHHVAHAASAHRVAPARSSAVLVVDGRGERGSYLAGHVRDGDLEILRTQDLPHSLGLLYEDLTQHLGFRRSSDEYKVMALASYGRPRHLDALRRAVRVDDGSFEVDPVDWSSFEGDDADLASSVQTRLEEVLLELACWLHAQTGEPLLTMAGGVALNCVANSHVFEHGPFEQMWVQPAAGDAGTALGAALEVAHRLGDRIEPMSSAALGPQWDDDAIEVILQRARVPYRRSDDVAAEVASVIADDGLVAWFQGRSEFGPRALGHRSLLAHPGRDNLHRLNDVKGREQFRPIAPMVMAERAEHLFQGGPLPSPFMLFTHRVRDGWRDRLPTVTHVDGTARAQTVERSAEPTVHRMLECFEGATGLPAVVNTSLNTAGRPMVDSPRDALECFGSSPIDVLAIGSFTVRRRRPG